MDIWLEYAQYTIGGMGEPDGVTRVRSVFDRAVSEVGLHVTKGSNIWDAYREFENAILAGLKVRQILYNTVVCVCIVLKKNFID